MSSLNIITFLVGLVGILPWQSLIKFEKAWTFTTVDFSPQRKSFKTGESSALSTEFALMFFPDKAFSLCPILWAVELGLKTSPGAPFSLRSRKGKKQNTSNLKYLGEESQRVYLQNCLSFTTWQPLLNKLLLDFKCQLTESRLNKQSEKLSLLAFANWQPLPVV